MRWIYIIVLAVAVVLFMRGCPRGSQEVTACENSHPNVVHTSGYAPQHATGGN